jgi:hypothetical protein
MQALDGQRQRLQQEIVEICGRVDACQACGGLCCQGQYNHFTVIDYLVRMYSDRPIVDYGDTLPEQLPLYRVVPAKIVESLRGRDEFDEKRGTLRYGPAGCPDLTPTGCRFPAAERPIRCVLWTCMALRRDLNDADFRKMGALIRDLHMTSEEIIRAFRRR